MQAAPDETEGQGSLPHGQKAQEGPRGPHHQDPTLGGEQPSNNDLRYKVIAYCDDVKPAITSMEEFILVDKAMSLFEKSSGCKLHRDPAAGKCKFLALGRWRGVLTQEDLPCNFFSLSDHLDMLGVTLTATYISTRKINGDNLQERLKGQIGAWRRYFTIQKSVTSAIRKHHVADYGMIMGRLSKI